jgi:biopolymer transport protein ExbB
MMALLACLVVTATAVFWAGRFSAWAAEADSVAPAAEPAAAPAEAAPAAAPAPEPAAAAKEAEPAKKEAAKEAAKEGEGEEIRERKSFLTWMIEASGICGLVIFIISFIMVAVMMMCFLTMRRSVLMPPDFIALFEQKLNAKDYQGAYELARTNDSFVSRVLAAGLSKVGRGYEEAVAGMESVGADENMRLEHRLSYLALIGSIAPMLGLLGTVQGMVMSFEVIANSTSSPKPSELAQGISMALFTTLEGLIVAIPAIVFYGLFKNQVARMVLEIGMLAEGFMSRFSAAGKAKPSGGAAPSAAPAAPRE